MLRKTLATLENQLRTATPQEKEALQARINNLGTQLRLQEQANQQKAQLFESPKSKANDNMG
ncbi:MAG: hypothetical protein LW809_06750 [Vampirovibrionales bacterium]|jgi:hypothetical protein|nr:hypothetical protein [Vampirovibrionales bacterium]